MGHEPRAAVDSPQRSTDAVGQTLLITEGVALLGASGHPAMIYRTWMLAEGAVQAANTLRSSRPAGTVHLSSESGYRLTRAVRHELPSSG